MILEHFLNNSNKYEVSKLPNGSASTIKDFYNQIIKNTLPYEETIIKWNALLIQYIQKDDAVFFIRRYANASNKQWNLIRRGFLTEYPSGLRYVFCDNYLAHYFYLMALNNFTPILYEFETLIETRKFPYGYMRTTSEMPYQAFPKGKPVNINKAGWKLAHIYSVNQNDYNFDYKRQSKHLFPRGEQSDWKVKEGKTYPSRIINEQHSDKLRQIAIAHFLRLVHPINYFLVPKRGLSNFDIGEDKYLLSFIKEKREEKFGSMFLEYEKQIMAKQIEYKDYSNYSFNLKFGSTYINHKKTNRKSTFKNKTKRTSDIKKTANLTYSDRDMRILKAYLIDKDSYRTIEKTILKIPSPVRGGGFIVKGILNSYGVSGKHKGILENKNISNLISNSNGVLKDTLIKLREYINKSNQQTYFK